MENRAGNWVVSLVYHASSSLVDEREQGHSGDIVVMNLSLHCQLDSLQYNVVYLRYPNQT
jgi:hypothetical protein